MRTLLELKRIIVQSNEDRAGTLLALQGHQPLSLDTYCVLSTELGLVRMGWWEEAGGDLERPGRASWRRLGES